VSINCVVTEPSSNRRMSSVVNNISFSFPSSPLLSQRHDVKQSVLCPTGHDGASRCPLGSGSYCECLHIIKIPLCAVAQFVLIDKGKLAATKCKSKVNIVMLQRKIIFISSIPRRVSVSSDHQHTGSINDTFSVL
jgi:hypothetical protein